MGDRLVCEWNWNKPGWLQSGMRVVVDVSADTVTFENCHRPRRFWAVRTDESYTCGLSEILAVHRDWFGVLSDYRHGRNVTVSTPAGKAVFNSRMAGFEEVVAALRNRVGTNRGPLADNPNVWFLGIVVLAIVITMSGFIWAFR